MGKSNDSHGMNGDTERMDLGSYQKGTLNAGDLEIVFMFSGQGSQYFQMGKELFEENETFHDWMVRLDEIPRKLTGRSVLEALYSEQNRKGDRFDQTLLTHPAIFMLEYALSETLIQAGVKPDLVLGASLGSFAAATVAGYIGAEDALALVLRQALALEEHAEPGGMIAVLAPPSLYADAMGSYPSELASVNLSNHFVVSAKRNQLGEMERMLEGRKIGHQRLPVSLPFHSRWIDGAEEWFKHSMQDIPRKQGRLPLACCERAAILFELPDDYFWRVARCQVRFSETAACLERRGGRRYVDVGPSGTLATFMKYAMSSNSRSRAHSILTPFGSDMKNLSAFLSAIRGHRERDCSIGIPPPSG